ncbi:MAG TPA: Hsp20/alpha crystallin family protein [Actinomycetota bacterium]|jgi:HSP20 family protein|nr:Hsp20/alpha crystallin family protein [Actinomycetota bacterium]
MSMLERWDPFRDFMSIQNELNRDATEDSFQRIERRYGAFSRTLSMPTTAATERVEASFNKGVLTIELPKREEAKPKKVTVRTT